MDSNSLCLFVTGLLHSSIMFSGLIYVVACQNFIPDNAVLQWLFCFASADKCSYINSALKNQKFILKEVPTCSFVVTNGLVR